MDRLRLSKIELGISCRLLSFALEPVLVHTLFVLHLSEDYKYWIINNHETWKYRLICFLYNYKSGDWHYIFDRWLNLLSSLLVYDILANANILDCSTTNYSLIRYVSSSVLYQLHLVIIVLQNASYDKQSGT